MRTFGPDSMFYHNLTGVVTRFFHLEYVSHWTASRIRAEFIGSAAGMIQFSSRWTAALYYSLTMYFLLLSKDCDQVQASEIAAVQTTFESGTLFEDGGYEACFGSDSSNSTYPVTFTLERLFLMTSINVQNVSGVSFGFSIEGSHFTEYFDERLQSAVSESILVVHFTWSLYCNLVSSEQLEYFTN